MQTQLVIYFLDLICVIAGVFKLTSKPEIAALSGTELKCEMQLSQDTKLPKLRQFNNIGAYVYVL